jgi:hypothetical protein
MELWVCSLQCVFLTTYNKNLMTYIYMIADRMIPIRYSFFFFVVSLPTVYTPLPMRFHDECFILPLRTHFTMRPDEW